MNNPLPLSCLYPPWLPLFFVIECPYKMFYIKMFCCDHAFRWFSFGILFISSNGSHCELKIKCVLITRLNLSIDLQQSWKHAPRAYRRLWSWSCNQASKLSPIIHPQMTVGMISNEKVTSKLCCASRLKSSNTLPIFTSHMHTVLRISEATPASNWSSWPNIISTFNFVLVSTNSETVPLYKLNVSLFTS